MTSPTAEAREIPADIAELVLRFGKVEWGQTPEHDAQGHGEHIANSVRETADHFEQGNTPRHMHGLYLAGTETVLCHTGTSPNSPQIARALTGVWNWLVDQALSRPTAAPDVAGVRRAALTRMTALDEEMEAKHPGWMTGEPNQQSVSAPLPAATREDWVLVPREPTEAMLSACSDAIDKYVDYNADCAEVWSAMLAALPVTPAAPAQDGEA